MSPFWVFLLIFHRLFVPGLPARTLPAAPPTELTVVHEHQLNNNTWNNLMKFVDAEKGSNVSGMSELKRYFQRFGYLKNPDNDPTKSLTDFFDDDFESALVEYQKNLGLSATGKLDQETMDEVMSPRCGMSDGEKHRRSNKLHATLHYAYFYGQPRWARPPPVTLMYAFSPTNTITSLSMSDTRAAFQRSFARWSAVIPVNFAETEDYLSADIRIGWYNWDHGDGEPFDGVLGILAHSFSPENGRLHLDGAETWAVDFDREKSKVAVDLESVATHEIGHILGLAHTPVKDAVMYPSLRPRSKKLDLQLDDVEGIQALYGSNPNFKYNTSYESDESSSWSILMERRSSLWWTTFFSTLIIMFSLFS